MGKATALLKIFWAFIKISPISFGGGYAIIPLIEKEMIKNKWFNEEEMVDILALSGSAPGAVGINTAIFVGFRISGFAGAIVALLGMMMPTFAIVLLLAALFAVFKNNYYVLAAFKSIGPAIVALIMYAVFKTWKTSIIDKVTLVMVAAAVLILFRFNVNPLWLMGAGALFGVV